MLSWFKKWFGKKPIVIDGNDQTKNYTLYINIDGKLIARSKNLQSDVVGIGEWLTYQKHDWGIDQNVTVLDILCDPFTFKSIIQ